MLRFDSMMKLLIGIIALCLIKIAFFNASQPSFSIIPKSYADGSIVEWQQSDKIITANTDGTISYVWDYSGNDQGPSIPYSGGKIGNDYI